MIRVVVVDDSALFRSAFCAVLQSDPGLEVVATAKNGLEGVAMVQQHRPDIVTMDVNMPVLSGYEAVEQIMAICPTPIVIVTSSSTKQDEQGVMRALALGALDVVVKPDLSRSKGLQAARDLIEKLKALSKARVVRHIAGLRRSREKSGHVQLPKRHEWGVVAIASSAGGPVALAEIFASLPADLAGAVVVAQHIAEGYTPVLVNWLSSLTPLKVVEAEPDALLMPGTIAIGPSGRHLEVDEAGRLKLLDTPALHGCRPSGDVLLASVAKAFGSRAIGVVLSGMGRDGAKGAQAIRSHGGRTIAQDEASCAVFGMPKAAIEAGGAEKVLPADEIADEITRLLGRRPSAP